MENETAYIPDVPDDENLINEEIVPIGIARIREEWRSSGFVVKETDEDKLSDEKNVVFPEMDGGAGIGDYNLGREIIKSKLALSEDAIDRLTNTGELDSIVVQNAKGEQKRLYSESSVDRFQVDSAIDPDAVSIAAKAMADKEVAQAIDDMQAEIQELRSTQGKILQQMKDMLLLEVRNLKEQDRDLTSYVYELTEEIRRAFPKKKR